MSRLNIYCIIFALIIASGNLDAQNINPRASFQVNIGLPVNTTNKAFKGIMQGLVNGSTHFQYTLDNTLCFGLGVNYSYFTLNEFKVSEKIKGGLQMGSLFAKLGQEKFHTSNFGTDIGIKAGYNFSVFNSDSLTSQGNRNEISRNFYIEPQVGIMLTMDENTSIKLAVGYVFQDFGFSPSLMGLSSNNGFDSANFNKITQYLTIGFGYTHYFKTRK
jgi:hypothetical protein|tara:strand:- start:8184 stop:8834 length:651 start_codon:yes stop_codon:yes gene_type:complete